MKKSNTKTVLLTGLIFINLLFTSTAQAASDDMNAVQVIMMLLLVVAIGMIYFLPTIISSKRNHHQGASICAVNILLGWTFLGWAIALIWSLSHISEEHKKKEAEKKPNRQPNNE